MKAWSQTAKIRPPVEDILIALEKQKKSDDWWRDGGQYVPYPASWIRAWQWADE